MCEAFRMNKAKRPVAEEITKEDLKKNFFETSSFTWNAPSFLVKKHCKEEET
jgi:hypothetical protein